MRDPRASMPPASPFQPNEEKIRRILSGDMKTLNDYANELGQYLANKDVSFSQLRSILDEVQKVQKVPTKRYDEKRLLLLRPKLAYVVSKQTRRGTRDAMNDFKKTLDKFIINTNESNFLNFRYFVEAVIAYHRYHERGHRSEAD